MYLQDLRTPCSSRRICCPAADASSHPYLLAQCNHHGSSNCDRIQTLQVVYPGCPTHKKHACYFQLYKNMNTYWILNVGVLSVHGDDGDGISLLLSAVERAHSDRHFDTSHYLNDLFL